MALFQMRWLRKLVRRRTTPIPYQTAAKWKGRLSLIYGLLAWNAFGFVCYMIYTGRNDWAKYYGVKSDEDDKLGPGRSWAKFLNIPNAKVIRFSGMERISETEITNTPESEHNIPKPDGIS